ncbi:hypothetical protein FNV43_RR22788 [Rhamnella rubrinervis]|uniref:Calcineurin-like phosphoesterase domain-containing protein n=1 Tax=Rhamnella rubrinervis TaxID=2594499 RepID=A0A8K0DS63_9ROSA|nr:hypothetical protein FNV43_RR22788 [Rhamnella rubrinervis]
MYSAIPCAFAQVSIEITSIAIQTIIYSYSLLYANPNLVEVVLLGFYKDADLEVPGTGTVPLKTSLKDTLGFDHDFLPAVVGAHVGWVLLFVSVFAFGIKFLELPEKITAQHAKQIADPKAKPRVVCRRGDLHGYRPHEALKQLVQPRSNCRSALIFLDDYFDRGPETHKVIDFLISLPSAYPHQKHVFLSGNHDLAFAAFVGVLPLPPDGSKFWRHGRSRREKVGNVRVLFAGYEVGWQNHPLFLD